MSIYRRDFTRGEDRVEVSVTHLAGTRYRVQVGAATHEVDAALLPDGRVRLQIDGHAQRNADAAPCGKALHVRVAGRTWQLQPAQRAGGGAGPVSDDGSIEAPMTGTVARVMVQQGDEVEIGAPILVLTAMKMEHKLTAGRAGVVAELHASEGDTVDQGKLLARIATK